MDAREEVVVDADDERLKSFHSACAPSPPSARPARMRRARRRRVNAIVLAVVAGLVAFMLALALGCSSSVPQIVRDRAPAARRAAEVYVERTEPRAGLTEEEREETRILGEALIRYLREMEAATR